MKEEDKYYKPELDEIYTAPDLFYTGEGLFSDKILINPFLYRSKEVSFDLRDVLNLNIVLVKYLDKEDIESFGFICTGYNSDGYKFQNIIDDYLFYDIDYNPEDSELIIEKFYQSKLIAHKTGEYNSNTLFHGFIKNKSELKVLLKQLGLL